MRSLVSVLAVVCFSAHAAFASPQEALRYYEAAEARYQAQEFLPAITLYAAAYRAEQDPAYLFNLAQCYRRAGDSTHAAELLARYLQESPAAQDRATVEESLLVLRALAPTLQLELPDLTPEPLPAPLVEAPAKKKAGWRLPLFSAAGLIGAAGVAAFFLSGPGVPNTALGHQDAFRD